MTEGDKFMLQLTAFVKKAKGNADLVVRKVVLDLGTRVVERSPVGDGSLWKNPPPKGYIGGRFRGNWQYSTMAPAVGELPTIDRTGGASIRRIIAGVSTKESMAKVHYIVNNLPYAHRLESGWSKQAPGGMIGLAIAEFQGTVERVARSLNP